MNNAMERKKFTFTPEQIAILGVLMALRIILSRFAIQITPSVQIAFGFIVASMIGKLFGPWVAGFAGVGTDLLTTFLFGQSNFFFGFTLTAFLGGFIYGAFLHREEIKWGHVLGAVVLNTIVSNLLLNTLWINILFSTPFTVLLASRIPQNLIMAPIRFGLIYLILRNKQLQDIYQRYSTANK